MAAAPVGWVERIDRMLVRFICDTHHRLTSRIAVDGYRREIGQCPLSPLNPSYKLFVPFTSAARA